MSAKQRALRIYAALFEPRPNDGSIRIALLMIVVSIATGPLTYLVTEHSERAGDIEEARLHEAVEEAYLRRTMDALVAHEQSLFISYARHQALYEAHHAALQTRPNDVAHRFGLQSEWDQALAAWGGFRWAYPEYDGTEQLRYPEAAARELLTDQLEGGRLYELNAWEGTATQRAEEERQVSLRLVALVVALVLALLVFTAAQVTRARARLVLALVATTVALASFVAVVAIDRSPVGLAAGLIGSAAFALVAAGERVGRSLRLFALRRIRSENAAEFASVDTGARGPAQISIPHPRELGSLFARSVAVVIAAATLCGAWIGYLQADAFGRGESFRYAGQAHGLRALTEGEREQALALAQVESHGIALQDAVAVWGGSHALRYAVDFGDDQTRERAEITLDQLRQTAAATKRVVTVKPEALPPNDPAFPALILAEANLEHDRLTALQLMSDREANAWDGRGAFYVRWLVIIAITIYLLGLAVVVSGARVKLLFLLAGGLGVCIATSVTTWTLVNHPGASHPGTDVGALSAAEAYADGRHDLATGEYAEAERAFTIAARGGGFGQAEAALADAAYLAGSQQTAHYTSVSKEAVRTAIGHHEAAIRAGYKSYAVHANLGWERLLLSVQTPPAEADDRLLSDSIASSSAAIDLLPTQPVPHFNLALALLAGGDIAASQAEYRAAMELSRGQTGSDPEGDEANSIPSFNRNALLASALTDLELLKWGRPDIAIQADRVQAELVRGLAAEAPLEGEAIPASRVKAEWLPTTLAWQAPLDGLDPSADKVVQVWYHRPTKAAPWAVFGSVDVLSIEARRHLGAFALFFPPDGETPLYRGELDHTARSGLCVPDGEFRVDLYVNGGAVARSEALVHTKASDQEQRIAWWPQDVGVLACVPQTWHEHEVRDPQVAARVSADQDRGLVLARVHFSTSAESGVETLLDSVRSIGIGPVPAGLELSRKESPTPYFLVGSAHAAQVWTSTTDEYRVLADQTDEGTVRMAILFGPRGYLSGDAHRDIPINSSLVQMDMVWGLRGTSER